MYRRQTYKQGGWGGVGEGCTYLYLGAIVTQAASTTHAAEPPPCTLTFALCLAYTHAGAARFLRAAGGHFPVMI